MNKFPEVPGYQIERELGRGGMATVFLAREKNLDREVALKMIATNELSDPSMAQRFIQEAKTAARLNHSNIVSIYNTGHHQSKYFIAMEYLSGGDLKSKIQDGLISEEESLDILMKLAGALDYAHEKGFIHRDVKPENIMFREDGTAVLVDFGIAKSLGADAGLTAPGTSIGTVMYMSPEQGRGKTLCGASDFYSLGVVFYEMLTGDVPYQATDNVAVILKHVNDPIPHLKQSQSRYQPLIESLMHKDLTTRIKSLADIKKKINTLNQINEEQSDLGISEFHINQKSTDNDTNIAEAVTEEFPVNKAPEEDLTNSTFRKRSIIGLVLVLLILSCFMVFMILKKDKSSVKNVADQSVKVIDLNRNEASTDKKNKNNQIPDRLLQNEETGKVKNIKDFTKMEWIQIKAGNFLMGSNQGASDERPVHKVYLDEFYISKYEITFEQYDAFCVATGGAKKSDEGWGRGNHPVINVNWHDAVAYCKWLSQKTGQKILLPTEAQWEKSCKENFGDGTSITHDEVAWYQKNSKFRSHPVGTKRTGDLGINDILGNVAEWCLDWYQESYYQQHSALQNPVGPVNGIGKVIRGGGWNSRVSPSANYLRSDFRSEYPPNQGNSFVGFRIVKMNQ